VGAEAAFASARQTIREADNRRNRRSGMTVTHVRSMGFLLSWQLFSLWAAALPYPHGHTRNIDGSLFFPGDEKYFVSREPFQVIVRLINQNSSFPSDW
jgi:hypothetical protein